VLVVDDSAFMRRLITEIVESRPEFLVVGTAADGADALAKVKVLRPDIVTLDIQMPVLDGLTALAEIMSSMPRPVVMLSAAGSAADNSLTIRALELGAVDFVRKPSGPVSIDLATVRTELLRAMTAASLVRVPHNVTPLQIDRPELAERSEIPVRSDPARGVVVVAASTGGPKALSEMVSTLSARPHVAILVVQHMPEDFLQSFAKRLAQIGPLPVSVGTQGEVVVSGRIYLAPGDRHMSIVMSNGVPRIHIDRGPPVCGVRPSADPLFRSAAHAFGENVVGVVLTGMGRDGTVGAQALVNAGAGVIVQNEASSVVWGMPGSVAKAGLASAMLHPHDLAARIAVSTQAS
jgi:two-component system chemotaxis response regulator CheB